MRIIGGAHRGRRLKAPPGLQVRPTSDRVREAVFNILGDVEGDRVLDVFAGSGALGLEALSRGAAHVTFVDSNRRSCETIRANVDLFAGQHAGQTRVLPLLAAKALRTLAADGARFDLLLLDPPYANAEALLEQLAPSISQLMSPGARLVAELEARQADALRRLLSDGYGLGSLDVRKYGQTVVVIGTGGP